MTVPGLEPGSFGSQPKILTTRLYRLILYIFGKSLSVCANLVFKQEIDGVDPTEGIKHLHERLEIDKEVDSLGL